MLSSSQQRCFQQTQQHKSNFFLTTLMGCSRRKVISISGAPGAFLVSGAKFFFLAAGAALSPLLHFHLLLQRGVGRK